jgi:NADPH:quinone reductase-like Zn-dependent oxidoreductase
LICAYRRTWLKAIAWEAAVSAFEGLKADPGKPGVDYLRAEVEKLRGFAITGVGQATAKLLAERGAHVVLDARRTDRLQVLAEAIAATVDPLVSARSRKVKPYGVRV